MLKVAVAVVLCIWLGVVLAAAAAAPAPFQSPTGPGWCDGRNLPGCVPWKYTDWPWMGNGSSEREKSTFVSPLPPMCPEGQRCGEGYLPWRPLPLAREPKERPVIDLVAARHGECIVRARAWMVDVAVCR